MHRVAPILLLAGVVLLVTWVVAPAAPSPSPLPARAEAAPDQTAPLVAEMAAQTERMRTHLEGPQEFPPPERNPFAFGARREVTPARPRAAIAEPEAPPAPPAPALPKLLAVVTNDAEGGVSLQAVFAVGDDVKVLKAGDAIGIFLIRRITADLVVELLEPVTGAVHRLTLR